MVTTLRLPVPNRWYALAFSGEPKAGSVQGEEVRCPFHGFRFYLEGRCTATGYGTEPPPKAHLKVWPAHKSAGVVFVWYDRHDCSPTWTPPAASTRGWRRLFRQAFRLRDHPQETVENGVDIGHFAIVHGYSEVEVEVERDIAGERAQGEHSAEVRGFPRPCRRSIPYGRKHIRPQASHTAEPGGQAERHAAPEGFHDLRGLEGAHRGDGWRAAAPGEPARR